MFTTINYKINSIMKIISIISLLVSFSLFLSFDSSNIESATKFLNSLNQDQREKVQLPFDHISKSNWQTKTINERNISRKLCHNIFKRIQKKFKWRFRKYLEKKNSREIIIKQMHYQFGERIHKQKPQQLSEKWFRIRFRERVSKTCAKIVRA